MRFNSLYNGKGTRTFENKDYYVEAGHFKNGEFTPNKLECITYWGTGTDMPYKPSDKSKKFIKDHKELFPAKNADLVEQYTDTEITYEKLMKSPSSFGDKLMKISDCNVVQIWDYADYLGYDHISELIVGIDLNSKVFRVYYLGETPDIYEGDTITIYGLPIDSSNYQNTVGGSVNCGVIFGAYIYE